MAQKDLVKIILVHNRHVDSVKAWRLHLATPAMMRTRRSVHRLQSRREAVTEIRMCARRWGYKWKFSVFHTSISIYLYLISRAVDTARAWLQLPATVIAMTGLMDVKRLLPIIVIEIKIVAKRWGQGIQILCHFHSQIQELWTLWKPDCCFEQHLLWWGRQQMSKVGGDQLPWPWKVLSEGEWNQSQKVC